jgi:hypothetical protein
VYGLEISNALVSLSAEDRGKDLVSTRVRVDARPDDSRRLDPASAREAARADDSRRLDRASAREAVNAAVGRKLCVGGT